MFEILSKAPDPGSIYDKWIEGIDKQLINSNPSVESFESVNLEDAHQRDTTLFPLLRYNMSVIDFWLSEVVFRREMKVFEERLTCTAWDLCNGEHLMTGFSGTNDTKNILPLPIAQNDLAELQSTNDEMLEVLLREENQSYETLPANVQVNKILQRLTERKIPVLLDAGALIKLDSKQVAMDWLNLTPQDHYDAAVYFDSNILQTIERNGVVAAYDCSVYRDNLSRCLVYLDDVHTRGTDLKFHSGCRAAVTLCGNITRDKTVQACMRMRQLGKTHSIAFLASFEADMRLRKFHRLSGEDPITNQIVIDFICDNSRQFEKDNLSHWVAAGLNYARKLVGHKLFDDSPQDEKSFDDLYKWCVEQEFVTLADMYGGQQRTSLKGTIETTMDELASDAKMTDETREIVNKLKCGMIDKLETIKAHDMKNAIQSLDEEQEKELEKEPQEREIQRPGKCEPSLPPFNDIERLKTLVLEGAEESRIAAMKSDGGLMSMADSLTHTGLYKWIGSRVNAWDDHLLVTKDFKTVIKSTEKYDEFLRPIWWIARIKSPKTTGKYFIILLSTFECEQLKSTFQKSTMSTLMMYRPPISKSHSNLTEIRALHVTGMTDDDDEDNCKLTVNDEIQIGIYSGMMYFHSEAELKAYCDFLGVILNPEIEEQEHATEEGTVPLKNQKHSNAISECVGRSENKDKLVELAKELIKAHHESLPKDAHATSILLRGNRPNIE